jgi:hypothetical protein
MAQAKQGRMSIFGELWSFMKVRKKWWLGPIVVTMLLLSALIVLTAGLRGRTVHLRVVLRRAWPPRSIRAHCGAGIGSRRAIILSSLATSALAFLIFAPILYYMFLQWGMGPDYSHGYIIAPLAAYFIWERRRKLARTPVEPSWYGLIPLGLGLLALAIGRLGVEQMSMRVAFVLTLIGLQLLLLGIPMARVIAFPMCFLFLMVPLPQSLVNVIAFPLQLIAADLAVSGMHLFGYAGAARGKRAAPAADDAVRAGCVQRAPLADGARHARDPVRLLLPQVVAGADHARRLRRSRSRSSSTRSASPDGCAHLRWGPQMAEGAIHQTEGFFTFGMAFALLMLEATLLSMLLRAIAAVGKGGNRRIMSKVIVASCSSRSTPTSTTSWRGSVRPARESFAASRSRSTTGAVDATSRSTRRSR